MHATGSRDSQKAWRQLGLWLDVLFCSNTRCVFLFWGRFSNSVFSNHFSACSFLLEPNHHKSEVMVHNWSPIRTYLCLCQCHVSCLGFSKGLLVYLFPSVTSESGAFLRSPSHVGRAHGCTISFLLATHLQDVKNAWLKLSISGLPTKIKLRNPIFNMALLLQSYIKHWSHSPS